MHFSSLDKRPCPVCQSIDTKHVIFEHHIEENQLDPFAFSARKTPEFMHFKLVTCPSCDLLYAHSIPKKEFLQNAYQKAAYDSGEEAHFAAKTYEKWFRKIAADLPDHGTALEVGAGNGAFLQYLLAAGFEEVIGIEPSLSAISEAHENIKKHIQIGPFHAEKFKSNHFSFIAIFQTLEHIDQPQQFFVDAFRLLKPGGILMIAAHNHRHWLMRLLGKKSPIIDIEHLQIFSPPSLQFALHQAGFQKTQIHALQNRYPLHYWVKLLPIPRSIKNPVLSFLKQKKLGYPIGMIPITMKVGNMIAWTHK